MSDTQNLKKLKININCENFSPIPICKCDFPSILKYSQILTKKNYVKRLRQHHYHFFY